MKNQRVAIITGAGSGIGFGIAKSLLSEGFYCCIVDSNPALEEGVNSLFSMYEMQGEFICDDTSNWESAERVFSILEHKGLHPTLLVNNVSPRRKTSLFEETEESWDTTIGGSLKSCFTYSREFLRNKQGNEFVTIVNIGSVSAEFATDQSASYHVAKSGVEALTRYFAVESKLGGFGATVNCLRLGIIVQERHRERFTSDINLGFRENVSKYLFSQEYVGEEADVANAILFLAESSSQFINGSVIVIDGGGSAQEHFSLLNRNRFP